MMTQSELEQERYEARLKMQRDINTALKEARDKGRAEELAKRIHRDQHRLHGSATAESELRALPLPQLEQLAEQLDDEIGQRLASGK